MYLAGHVGLALVVAAALVVVVGAAQRGFAGTVVLVLLASAPDVDLLLEPVTHRGITHTVWAAFGLGLVLAAGGWLLARRSQRVRADHAAFAFCSAPRACSRTSSAT